MIADPALMTPGDLQRWVANAYAGALSGTTVPSVAAEGPHGRAMALKWIDAPDARVAAAGWATWSALISITDDQNLDLAELRRLLNRVQQTIHEAPDMVRYQMNGFVIAVGSFVAPLTQDAINIAEKIGPVSADLGDNNCQVPFAPAYIRKVQQRGSIGRKRKRAMC
jgi:hypothetical protein